MSLSLESTEELREILGDDFVESVSNYQFYGRDESHALEPDFLALAFPRSHDQLASLVKWANKYRVPLVPSGGRTGLSGGACAGNHELVVSLERMNGLLEFNELEGFVSVEAGFILEDLHNFLEAKGWFYPVDYASRGSAQIGAAVATNAGGIRVIRYGMTRDWVLGLKAVTGTGDTLDIQRKLVKDNAGYDLKQLLIGSEGTLAFITEVTLKITRPLPEQQTLLIGVDSIDAMMECFAASRKLIDFSAAEFFCHHSLELVTQKLQKPIPFRDIHAYYLLLEFDKDIIGDDDLAGLLDAYDVLVATNIQQAQQFWQYRELISSTINPLKPYKNDIACRLEYLGQWLNDLEEGFLAVNAGVNFSWFGHLGDGNVHLNVLKHKDMSEEEFEQFISGFEAVVISVCSEYPSTISAEHGIGLLKKNMLGVSRTTEELGFYYSLKKLFDPNGILNPGKLLPDK